jgi:hypothetical protein
LDGCGNGEFFKDKRGDTAKVNGNALRHVSEPRTTVRRPDLYYPLDSVMIFYVVASI